MKHENDLQTTTQAPLVHHSGRRWVTVVLGITLALGLTACSSASTKGASGSPSSASGGANGQAIIIQNFAFVPGRVTVKPGASVMVENKDSVTHTLTSTSGVFDTGNISGGSTAHFTAPTKPGSYPYRCNIHQFMTGTLVVS